jgi:hypothetical protein
MYIHSESTPQKNLSGENWNFIKNTLCPAVNQNHECALLIFTVHCTLKSTLIKNAIEKVSRIAI